MLSVRHFGSAGDTGEENAWRGGGTAAPNEMEEPPVQTFATKRTLVLQGKACAVIKP
jgi:hypothetical protein